MRIILHMKELGRLWAGAKESDGDTLSLELKITTYNHKKFTEPEHLLDNHMNGNYKACHH